MIFLENTREFPEIIPSTGAKIWLRFCLSILALVIFKSPNNTKVGNGWNTVSRVLFRRRELTEPHWVLRQTRWVLRKTRWVRFGTQIIGWKELTEFSPRNSVSSEKLTEFGVWNRTPRNRIRPVSEKVTLPRVCKPWFPNRGSRFVTKQRLKRG